MPLITLKTKIQAPVERCFDLSTSIDLHKKSVEHTQEEVVSGRTNGLMQLNEEVTWRAKHLGVWFVMTVRMTDYERPYYFCDEMVSGPFQSMAHQHYFEELNEGTLMIDKFRFVSPLGVLGRLANATVLKKHLTELLFTRNEAIKTFAETNRWQEVLPS
ncbi:SRPBCC family protein [Tunicatimonas pelagia]|uniref:SRPBCC family protein n=1 Tax=Tunicatimonas pelagia TaxID=931531 RepID=UPI002666F90F|nr:SRPBCC family protein [Tunicatimonas pelagia]WKN44657.1 SRPBCC family protein [Tunicatimonas pelagia]